jgi:hypothetical protein
LRGRPAPGAHVHGQEPGLPRTRHRSEIRESADRRCSLPARQRQPDRPPMRKPEKRGLPVEPPARKGQTCAARRSLSPTIIQRTSYASANSCGQDVMISAALTTDLRLLRNGRIDLRSATLSTSAGAMLRSNWLTDPSIPARSLDSAIVRNSRAMPCLASTIPPGRANPTPDAVHYRLPRQLTPSLCRERQPSRRLAEAEMQGESDPSNPTWSWCHSHQK